jgi:hypothetical protein
MKKMIFIVAIVVLGGLLCGTFEAIHPFGVPADTAMDDYFLDHALADRSAQNVVTSLVFDFRGFDTVGEALLALYVSGTEDAQQAKVAIDTALRRSSRTMGGPPAGRMPSGRSPRPPKPMPP